MKNIKYAIRSILSMKQNAFLNWVGITIGLSSFALVLTWAIYHWSFDKCNKDYKQIHLVQSFYDNENDLVMPYPMAQFVKDKLPEVEYAATYTYWPDQMKVSVGENDYFEFLTPTQVDIFNILDFDFICKKNELFIDPSDIAICESVAEKFFGTSQCLGETLIVADSIHGQIAAVYKDFPKASTFSPSLLCNYALSESEFVQSQSWNNYSYYTLVKLGINANLNVLNAKLTVEVYKQLEDDEGEDAFGFYPLEKIHLNHPGESSMERHLLMVLFCGFLVLLVSCINFVNLLTSGFLKKSTQTTIRRSLGASRGVMIKSSLLEIAIYFFAALVTSLLLTLLCWPFIEAKLGIEMDAVYGFGGVILIQIITAFFVYVIVSSYPVLIFWRKFYSQKSMTIGKSSFQLNRTGKAFVIIQFVVAIFIGIVSFVMQEQLKHAVNTDKGYSVKNVIFAECWDYPFKKHESAIKEFLDSNKDIISYSITENSFNGLGSRTTGFAHPEWTDERKENYRTLYRTDENLLATTGIDLVAGRFFEPKTFSEEKSVVINKTFAKQLGGIDSAMSIMFEGDYKIIGVCDDFLFESFYTNIEPLVILYNTNWVRNILVKTYDGKKDKVLAELDSFLKSKSNAPFRVTSIDELISDMYRVEESQKTLLSIFGLLTILVSCMGLFGLTIFIIEQKTKEIGVRKVNGATVIELVKMLNRDFIIWVIIAFIIASPIAWYAMQRWLEGFAYKTTINWWIFALAGCTALSIALLTVSWQTYRAARRNPVEALRYE